MGTMPPPAETTIEVGTGLTAVTTSTGRYQFAAGHLMQDTKCPVCSRRLGGAVLAAVGAVAIGYNTRAGNEGAALAFLVHASHLPLSDADLQSAITSGLQGRRR